MRAARYNSGMDATRTVRERLAAPLARRPGIGSARAELLERLGLRTAGDLLFFFPRDYQEFGPAQTVAEFTAGERVSIEAEVEEVELRSLGPGRSMFGVLLRQGAEYVRAVWFNQAFRQKRFRHGQRVRISGAPRLRGQRWEFSHPQVEHLSESAEADDQEDAPLLLPVYSLTQGINQAQMRKMAAAAVDELADLLEDVFPAEERDSRKLCSIGDAVRGMHQPRDRDALDLARRRLVYQELLILQLALAIRRGQMRSSAAPALEITAKIDARIRRRFPFKLTDDQQQAVAEIAADLGQPHPMNRLLQGEVGSGKTVVAEYAMLAAVALGNQAVLMAPTDVLARQHQRTLLRDLAESKVRIGLLTGSLPAAQRRQTLEQVRAGELDILVGTQAIANAIGRGDAQFPRLALVIIDEQHKFGVQQRAELKRAGVDAHYLVMTATPIPRTVAISLFGDLDVSILRRPPAGRQPVNTYLGEESQRDRWWEFFRKKLREGRQGYVIVPLVEESETLGGVSLIEAFESLANDRLESFRVDMVHGRMSGSEKDAVMEAFRCGDVQVLAATSVVEVGVDVPNATLMTIEAAERFGLAQLHQLRGRVSRGKCPGYVCAFSHGNDTAALERLQAFASTSDGFELAELDFQLRGPGDIFGVRQHGMPPFRVADLQRDSDVLEEARRDADALIAEDPELEAEPWRLLRRMVYRRFGEVLDLGDVG